MPHPPPPLSSSMVSLQQHFCLCLLNKGHSRIWLSASFGSQERHVLLERIVLELSCLVSFSVTVSPALRLFSHFLAENTGGNTLPLQLLSFWAELNSPFGRQTRDGAGIQRSGPESVACGRIQHLNTWHFVVQSFRWRNNNRQKKKNEWGCCEISDTSWNGFLKTRLCAPRGESRLCSESFKKICLRNVSNYSRRLSCPARLVYLGDCGAALLICGA